MIQYAIYQSKANNYTKGKFYARAIHTDIVDLGCIPPCRPADR